MFGFSIQKLIFTVLVVVVVWYVFKMIGRLDERKKAQVNARGGSGKKPAEAPGARSGSGGDAEDMLACPRCGTYVSRANPSACGRSDCPYPG